MPPRLNILSACRALPLRPRIVAQWPMQTCIAARARSFADDSFTTSRTPDMDDLPASMFDFGKSEAEKSEKSAPEPELSENEKALRQLQKAAYGLDPFDVAIEGHKYGVPDLPLVPRKLFKQRYDPVVEQVTKLLMKDGKLAKAQRDMAIILNHLRSSPPPKYNPAKPLMPGTPPSHELPLDPVTYLTVAIESVAPLIRIRNYKGLAGGGRSLEVPMPLGERQRRRTAVMWILDTVRRKPSKGSGRNMFPTRVAEEIVAVMEGRSPVWDKRHQVHKQGTSARANVTNKMVKGFR